MTDDIAKPISLCGFYVIFDEHHIGKSVRVSHVLKANTVNYMIHMFVCQYIVLV